MDFWQNARIVVGFLDDDGNFIDKSQVKAERGLSKSLTYCHTCKTLNTGKVLCKYDVSAPDGVLGFCGNCLPEADADFILE